MGGDILITMGRSNRKHQFRKYPESRKAKFGKCGKACYKSKDQAETYMNRLISEGRDQFKVGIMNVYKCDICGGVWHVGHSSWKLEGPTDAL